MKLILHVHMTDQRNQITQSSWLTLLFL